MIFAMSVFVDISYRKFSCKGFRISYASNVRRSNGDRILSKKKKERQNIIHQDNIALVNSSTAGK